MVLTMKANEVMNLLRISRKTLHVYANDGKIRCMITMMRMFINY